MNLLQQQLLYLSSWLHQCNAVVAHLGQASPVHITVHIVAKWVLSLQSDMHSTEMNRMGVALRCFSACAGPV